MVLYVYYKLIGGILMKKTILVLLLIVSIFSSFMVVNAATALSAPEDVCPQCGLLGTIEYWRSDSQAVGTVSCSHHIGYTDTIYNEYSFGCSICNDCGYTQSLGPVITATYIVCGYNGSIYYQ